MAKKEQPREDESREETTSQSAPPSEETPPEHSSEENTPEEKEPEQKPAQQKPPKLKSPESKPAEAKPADVKPAEKQYPKAVRAVHKFTYPLGGQLINFEKDHIFDDPIVVRKLIDENAPVIPVEQGIDFHICPKCYTRFKD